MMTNSPVKNWRDTKILHHYLGKKGRLLFWTKISTAPAGFEYQVPYFVGIVAFADGEKMPLQIVDCTEKDLRLNAKIKIVIRRTKKPHADDVIDYWVKAKIIS